MGDSCRSLLGGLCVGLVAWVAMVRADASCTDFFFHGFSKLTPGIKHYAAVASLVAYVPDAALSEFLVDDRMARHAELLQEIVAEEIFWIENVGPFTWARFNSLLGKEEGDGEMRQTVVKGPM